MSNASLRRGLTPITVDTHGLARGYLLPKNGLGIKYEPFALTSLSDADKAASPVIGVYQIAEGPKPIDDEDFDEFCNRWADLSAKAAKGQLEHPRVLPLK